MARRASVGALFELPVLAGDHGDVIERVGVFRLALQHLYIALHGRGDVALTVMEQALLQQFGGPARGGGAVMACL